MHRSSRSGRLAPPLCTALTLAFQKHNKITFWPQVCKATAWLGVPLCPLTVRALLARAKEQAGVSKLQGCRHQLPDQGYKAIGPPRLRQSEARSCWGHVGNTCVARSKATASRPISSSTEVFRRRLLEPRIGEQRRCCYLAGAFAHIHVPCRPQAFCTQPKGYNVAAMKCTIGCKEPGEERGGARLAGQATSSALLCAWQY